MKYLQCSQSEQSGVLPSLIFKETEWWSHLSSLQIQLNLICKCYRAVQDRQISGWVWRVAEAARNTEWAVKRQMRFSVDKCKIMHMRNNNPNYTHTMMESKLAAIAQKQIVGNSLVLIKDQRTKPNARELSATMKHPRKHFFCSRIKTCWVHTLNMTLISAFAPSKKILVVVES